MKTTGGADAPTDNDPTVRYAVLQEPRIAKPSWTWWLVSGFVELALSLVTLVAGFLVWVAVSVDQPSYLPYDFFFAALGGVAVICTALLWWLWRLVYRWRDRQDRRELLATCAAPLTNVPFSDGSVSDFTPEGEIIQANGTAMAFDLGRGLARVLNLRHRNSRTITLDFLKDLEGTARLEVRNEPERGLIGWPRRLAANRCRSELSLVIVSVNGEESKPSRIAAGFEEKARELAGKVNAAIASRRHD